VTTAAVYCRISADPAGLRAGVERQEEDCLAFASRRGWDTQVYVDNDLSAYQGKPRPAYREMLAAVEAGDVQVIVAWAPDRLTRHLRELEELVSLVERKGAQVATVQAGDWDLSTPEGRFMARQLGLLARLEAEKIASRVQRARIQEAKGGKPNAGGRRPWGFEADKVAHHEVEAAQIRDAAARLLRGESLRSVSRRVGKMPKDVKRALLSERMIGKRTHKGVLHDATWEPILERTVWDAIRTLLTDPRRDFVLGRNARSYLLSGFVYAPCGAVCQSARTGAGVRRYKCQVDFCADRSAEKVEDVVRDWVLERSPLPSADAEVDPALSAEVAAIETSIAALERDYYTRRRVSEGQYEELRADLEDQLADASARLLEATQSVETAGAGLVTTVGDTGIPHAVWDRWQTSDLRQRRLWVARYAEKVNLMPVTPGAGRFDKESVQVVPKDSSGRPDGL
jgi:site-specific DNA recombinase